MSPDNHSCTWLLYWGATVASVFALLVYRSSRLHRGTSFSPSEARAASEARERRRREKQFLSTGPGRMARVLGWCALLTWFSFIGQWEWYDVTLPTQTAPSAERTHELDTHGHVVFLNTSEQQRLNALAYGAATLCLGAVTIWIVWQRKNPGQSIAGGQTRGQDK
jgi:hypothetical protein